jgi:two-component system, response regulator YesN
MADHKLELEKYKLANLLRTNDGDFEDIRRLCEEIGFPVNRHYMGLAIRFGEEREEERDCLAEIQDFWQRYGYPSVGERLDKGMAVVITAFRRHEEERVKSLTGALLRQFSDLTIGLGSVSSCLEGVAESCKTALSALQRSFYQPDVRRFAFVSSKPLPAAVRTDVVVDFVRCLKNEPGKLSSSINELCDFFVEDGTQSRERVLSIFSSFAQAMLREKNGILMGAGRVYQVRDVEILLESADSIEAIRRLMLELCETYLEEVQKASPYSRTVRTVMAYIAAHCSNADLDIRGIAEHLHMSSAHLGMLFRQETGTTIKQYISDYRLELAKKLIGNENCKMNEVAEICGYASASYFAKVFKAATNLTPVEYRKSKP